LFSENRNYLTTCQRRLLRHFPFRRRSKSIIILSLLLCVTVIKLCTTTPTIEPLLSSAFDEYSGGNDAAGVKDLSYRRYTGLLAEPNCDALVANDYQEILLTKAMLYRESRSSVADHYPPADCSPTWFRRHGFRQVGNISTVERASTSRHPVAFLISVDADSTLEKTLTLLGSLHDESDIYCLAVPSMATSRDMRQAFRQVSRCLSNVITVFRHEQSVDCKQRNACTKEQLNNTTVLENMDSSHDWECVRQLQSFGLRSATNAWTYLVKLSTFHLPVHPSDILLELLNNEKIDNNTLSELHVNPFHSTVELESLNFTSGRAYSRQTVERLLENRQHLANGVVTRRSFDSLGGSTAEEDDDQYESISKLDSPSLSLTSHQVIELSTEKECVDDLVSRDRVRPGPRCIYAVADLAYLARVKTPFAYAFDIDRDHMVVECVLKRRRRHQR